jgi:hypothetical protein
VQVFARGEGSPALEVGFTSLDPTTPPSSVFAFSPPPGTKVTEATTPTSQHSGDAAPGGPPSDGTAPHVVGSGWTSVVVAHVPTGTTGSGTGPATPLQVLLQKLPEVQGAWGSGHLLQGTLFTAILTDDGDVAVGAVAPGLLEQALNRR